MKIKAKFNQFTQSGYKNYYDYTLPLLSFVSLANKISTHFHHLNVQLPFLVVWTHLTSMLYKFIDVANFQVNELIASLNFSSVQLFSHVINILCKYIYVSCIRCQLPSLLHIKHSLLHTHTCTMFTEFSLSALINST